ncbi:unnamed protein product [Haemonchus placei]|uniref:Integrase catalytic domain-containing protein n=1 Tax=Haemonchus placei TaxID=6290 RepID=A0A0N4WSX0_HAEPC|nr:unnamed protein product [Haemonchus placei]
MDYIGPFSYREDNITISKYWIILITCLNTRAIFTKVVTSMYAEALLHVLRPFIATNGFPNWIVCDNARVFKTINEIQSNMFSSITPKENAIDYCANRKMSFNFIASHSPWQGGVYERMVGMSKAAFRNAIRREISGIETSKTITADCTAICNLRPLTNVMDEQSQYPLRPIDFLRPTALIATPRFDCIEDYTPPTSVHENLMELWKTTNEVLTSF